MNRRGFLAALLGTAAATALPSEVWPFRKIFLPPAPRIIVPNALTIAAVEAVEQEWFAKTIPDLFFNPDPIFTYLKDMRREPVYDLAFKTSNRSV